MSFGTIPGSVSTPTGTRSPAENRCASTVSPAYSQAMSELPSSGGSTNTGEPSCSTRLRASRSFDPLNTPSEIVELAAGARDGNRVVTDVPLAREQQTVAVVDRVRRDHLVPLVSRLPLGVRRLPVPHARLQLAHSRTLNAYGVGPCKQDRRRTHLLNPNRVAPPGDGRRPSAACRSSRHLTALLRDCTLPLGQHAES